MRVGGRKNAYLWATIHLFGRKKAMAKQIRLFGMTRMTAGSCAHYHNEVIRLIGELTPEALGIADQLPAYAKQAALLSSLVPRPRAMVATHRLKEWDRKRVNSIGVINRVVYAYRTSNVTEARQAARRLHPQLSGYYGVWKYEYTRLSSAVHGMLAKLGEAENAAAVARLGLTDEVEALRAAQEGFETAWDGHIAEYGEIAQLGDIKTRDVRRELTRLYEGIVRTVNARALVLPTDAVREFVDSVNAMVEMYRLIIRQRGPGAIEGKSPAESERNS